MLLLLVVRVSDRPGAPGSPRALRRAGWRWSGVRNDGGAAGVLVKLLPGGPPGPPAGRCRIRRRAERATRAGTLISCVRRVASRALAWKVEARVPAARVRLNAKAASTSQAALAVNVPDGRWASGPSLSSGDDLQVRVLLARRDPRVAQQVRHARTVPQTFYITGSRHIGSGHQLRHAPDPRSTLTSWPHQIDRPREPGPAHKRAVPAHRTPNSGPAGAHKAMF